MRPQDLTWEQLGGVVIFVFTVYAFVSKWFPPAHVKAAEMAKAQSQGSVTAEEVMKVIRENNRETIAQIMVVIKEGFQRMEHTDEKIAEAIRQQVTAFTEMGFNFRSREQVTETLHKTGHAHMTRIEANQANYTAKQDIIITKMDDVIKVFKGQA